MPNFYESCVKRQFEVLSLQEEWFSKYSRSIDGVIDYINLRKSQQMDRASISIYFKEVTLI